MRKFTAMLLASMLGASLAAPLLLAQSTSSQTYSFTETSSLIVPDMTLRVYRDGSKELIDQSYPPRAENRDGFHIRNLYDFQAHKIYTWDLLVTSRPCSVAAYESAEAPAQLDPVSGSAEMTAGLAKQNPKAVGTETVNGIAAKILEVAGPPGQGKARVWLDVKSNVIVKWVTVSPSGQQATQMEIKQLSFTKPAGALFVPPAACRVVEGETSASGGHAELPIAPPATPATQNRARPTAPPGGGVQLQADSATTKEIVFSSAGGVGACRLERKNAKGEWPSVATISGGQATDSTIAAYATYTYRATCGAQHSNEVTVGPPPAGFHLIAAKPDKHPDTAFGRWISLAADSNGDPAVAFVYADPNGDGNYSDTQVMFTAWDRTAYRWKEPVVVATAPNFDPRPQTINVSLARDAQTGTFGIAWVESDNKTLTLALSRDGGATWKTQKALTDPRPITGPSMAFAAGKIHLAVSSDGKSAIRYMTGGLDEDPGKWRSSLAPVPAGALGAHRASFLALDSNGVPALAYWLRPRSGDTSTLLFWRPGSVNAVEVPGTTTAGYPPDGVLLAFHGTQPRAIIDARLEKGNVPTHYSLFSNDGGSTWSKPALIPDDGNERLGGFMSLAIGPNGQAAFAGDVLGGNTGGMKCSWPKLARSSDLAAWTTCAPQGGLRPDARSNFGSALFAPGGTLYLVFQNKQFSPAQELKPGLMIWGGR